MRKTTFCLLLLMLSISLSFGQYIVNFEGADETKTAYASGDVTLSGLSWNLTEVLIGNLATDWKNGTKSARLRGYGTSAMTMLENKTSGLGTLSFYYRRYATDAQVDWKVEYSIDNGSSWMQIGSVFTAPASDTPSLFSEDVNVSGDVRIRIKRATETGTSNNRLNIDDITLTDFTGIEVEPPTLQASNIIAYPANTEITLEWTPGNGARRLVKINTINSFTSPVDGSNLAANDVYSGIGEQVIFNGSTQIVEGLPLNGCNVSGLTPLTTYWFRIYEYNGSGSFTRYNTSESTNNPISAITTNTPGSDYYTGITGYGITLKTNLHNLLRTTHTTRYSYDALWIKLPYTDEDPTNTNNIIEIYTGWSVPKTYYGSGTSQWNREHTWSKSHGNFSETPPAGTDLHHLRPCDSTVNSAKSNKDFDYATTSYYDSSPYNGYPQDTGCKTSTYAWEPRDADKGDVARMIMYMAVRYEGTDTSYDLEIVDYTNTSGPYYGKLSTLLEWHIIDPPDSIEMERNNRIEELQGNRNPFIDEPLYAVQIWAPMPQNPTNITQTSFTANWSAPISATKYYLQLATDASFNNIVPGYDNLDAGLILSKTISGLSNTNTYYYRLRSFFVSGYSMYSPYMEVTLSASAQLNSGTALTEYNLNAAILQLNLVDTTWRDNILMLANFTINNAPDGLSLLSVQYLSSNSALLVMHFDNADFDDNILDFCVTIDAAEINYPSSITTNSLAIIAYVESPLTIQIQGQQLILNIQTVAEADAYVVFSSIEPYGIYSEISSSGNFDAQIPTRWTCILPTENIRFYKAAAVKYP